MVIFKFLFPYTIVELRLQRTRAWVRLLQVPASRQESEYDGVEGCYNARKYKIDALFSANKKTHYICFMKNHLSRQGNGRFKVGALPITDLGRQPKEHAAIYGAGTGFPF